MKNRKYILRIIGILTVGILLLKMTYHFKYSTFMFDLIIFGVLAIIGIVFLTWSIFTDIKLFRINKRISLIIPIVLGITFTIIIWVWNWKINSTFDKPTLIRIYYDGDFNGTGIDFKTDGTYIFDSSGIGLSDYEYGTYQINTNQIVLDKKEIDNVIKTSLLEIRPIEIEYNDTTEFEKYVFQIDENGNILNEIEFKLVVDNRKE